MTLGNTLDAAKGSPCSTKLEHHFYYALSRFSVDRTAAYPSSELNRQLFQRSSRCVVAARLTASNVPPL